MFVKILRSLKTQRLVKTCLSNKILSGRGRCLSCRQISNPNSETQKCYSYFRKKNNTSLILGKWRAIFTWKIRKVNKLGKHPVMNISVCTNKGTNLQAIRRWLHAQGQSTSEVSNCGGLTPAGCQVPTKSVLSLPLPQLDWREKI